MSPSTPPIVTLVSQLAGRQRTFPRHGGRVTTGELQSLHARVHQLIVLSAHLADTIGRIRSRAELEPAEVHESVNAVLVEHTAAFDK